MFGGKTKFLKISSILWSCIFVVGALFMWFRKTDGANIQNSSTYRFVSLGMWTFLFMIVLVVHLV
ncbi:DUF3923 family protein [Oenococcus sp. UCMA 14587]|nr:DUF3923 family protein [Oenococcus sp. UCMA 14587]